MYFYLDGYIIFMSTVITVCVKFVKNKTKTINQTEEAFSDIVCKLLCFEAEAKIIYFFIFGVFIFYIPIFVVIGIPVVDDDAKISTKIMQVDIYHLYQLF